MYYSWCLRYRKAAIYIKKNSINARNIFANRHGVIFGNKSVAMAIDFEQPDDTGLATYRTADELPAGYKVLAPIIEEVPKMLNEAEYMESGEDE